MLKTILIIGSGGFLGSISRFLLSRYLSTQWMIAFPVGTFTVNILGSFLIGIIMGLSFQSTISTQARLLLATGFCGGFTTFSTYSLEIFELYQRGEAGTSLIYLSASIVLGLMSIWAGLWIARFCTSN